MNRPTRTTLPFHAQAIRLLDLAVDHTWCAQRVKAARWWHLPQARELLALAREARAQVGPVLP
ncbi:MAG: hypothetical protein MUC67_12390 [Acidobacteria bacterium]|jgi:hypothetical protein|nr:hypothetical protein [Acidobacteriota bacterium]